MVLPAQAVGAAVTQGAGQYDGGTAEMARLRDTAKAIMTGEEHGAATRQPQAETAKAVQPTPVSAKAVKVDLDGGRAAKSSVVEYPVTGPDKFARTIAEAKQQAYVEEQRDAAGEAISEAAGAREQQASQAEGRAQARAIDARDAAADEWMDRGPNVSGANDSAVAQADAAMEADMAKEVEQEGLDRAAEKRREA